MGMTRELWSLNGLATELLIDRRTLAKYLSNLKPASERRVGDRMEKRWRLSDVTAHLAARKYGTLNGDVAREEATQEAIAVVKQFIARDVFPTLCDEQMEFYCGVLFAARDAGLTKTAAIQLFMHVALALGEALALGMEDPDIGFALKPDGRLRSIGAANAAGTLDEWVAANWPLNN